ncbi:TolC family protein [Roseobacter sp. YSTF-M11]|uniref:TolC family protein n=1 Tax=Roseobacter insulae TaxID=2859783 RepID=A0A9X1FZP4_9RHOB|nr:TolC family protein [Roseobacter insulae]MBW4710679.1 TolC family protein [Roseobacter insulae]
MKLLLKLLCAKVIPVIVACSASAESLPEAVRFAVTTNPAIKASQAEMRASAFELLQLRGEYEPQLILSGETGWQRVDDPNSLSVEDNDSTKPRNQLGLRAEVVLFDGFRRSNLVYANAARVDGSIFRLLDASETMALNATEAYIDVYRHRTLMTVARRNVAKHVEIGRRVRDLVQGGRLPYSDELTIDDRIRSARLAQLEVERALRDANARYARVIGRAPSGGMSIPLAPPPQSLSSLTQNAVTNSYRVQFARTQIDQTRFQSEVALSTRYPRLTLNAGVVRDINRNGVSGTRSDETIGVGLRWTLYQGGRQAERRALAEQNSRAMAQQAVAVRNVQELASRTWNSYRTNAERAAQLNDQLRINRLIVEVYGDEFEAAKRTLLDLLEVERARFNVEFEAVGAQAGLAFSTYRALAAQSLLAAHFGLAKSDLALQPQFQARVKENPTAIFNVNIEPLK